MLVSSLERGKITLQNYLERTVFYRARPFTTEAFIHHMFSLSTPNPETLQLGKELSRSGKYQMSTINNEIERELGFVPHPDFRLARNLQPFS